MILQKLSKAGLIHPPHFLVANTMYLTKMGSEAYAVSMDSSDLDIYGFCVPPKEMVFPHLAGVIPGFGDQGEQFSQWQEHHVRAPDKEVEYDFTVFNLVRYFQLCMDNNPNALDSLFTPRTCVIHSTAMSEHLRSNRRLFLHKGSYPRFRGYSISQLSKIRNKVNSSNPKRAADIEEFGYSTKFAYHVVRLALEAEQILSTHDLDLQRDREVLKSIRRGEWSLERIEEWMQHKEKMLEELYVSSTLQNEPNEKLLKDLLLECLEMHYGSLSAAVVRVPQMDQMLNDLRNLVAKYGGA